MSLRVKTFATKTAAQTQVRAINARFLATPLSIVRGRYAPPDDTRRYLLLEQYADGTWGHIVDRYVRTLEGVTVGSHTISVIGERDTPMRTIDIGGVRSQDESAAAIDVAGSDAP